jgi:NADH:ubiquinone oxidoreductase subunit H
MRYILITLCKVLIIVVSVLIALAYLTLLERKILGSMQLRMGPQVVGI